jgi:hypothetical protein
MPYFILPEISAAMVSQVGGKKAWIFAKISGVRQLLQFGFCRQLEETDGGNFYTSMNSVQGFKDMD